MSQQLVYLRSEAHPLRDSLTRALSLPQFALSIEEEKDRSDAISLPFVLCLIDIDALRNINDEFGRHCGDAILIETASRIRSLLDDSDFDGVEYLHARFDGDAFMLLARDFTIKRGERLAHAIRDAIRHEPYDRGIGVTATIGVTQYRIGESTDAVIARCEKTMYLAKQFGNDHVEVAATPENMRASNVVPLPNLAQTHRRRRLTGS
jgi:diguanylate cyclase (GGDEF)-like protein